MTSGSGSSRRSLRDDLLDDLRHGPALSTTPGTATTEPQAAGDPPAETPTVELRITPRSWSPAGWSSAPGGDGFTVTIGPLRLSLGRTRT